MSNIPSKLQNIIDKALKACRDKDPAWGVVVDPIEWNVNYRLKRVLGMACYYDNTITINGTYLETATEEAVYNTVTHELAHFIAWRCYREPGHGRMWKYVHINLEGTAERCTNARLHGYNSVKNRVKRVILEKNGKEAGCTIARYERDKVGFARVGYIYKRTIIRESDGSETIIHKA